MNSNDSHGNAGTHFLLPSALAYAWAGWPVFPLINKVPAIPKKAGGNGYKDASVDPDRIRGWLVAHPEANGLGHPTGGGKFILDVDPPHGGEESLSALTSKHGQLPATLTVETPTKGRHLYFNAPPGLKIPNSTWKLGAGLDIRGDGGYVVLPPSRHPIGREESYKWVEDCPIASAPDWLLGIILSSRKKSCGEGCGIELSEVFHGSRNTFIFQQALAMRGRGVPEQSVIEECLDLNRKRCTPPLSSSEVERTARSASTYGPNPCKVVEALPGGYILNTLPPDGRSGSGSIDPKFLTEEKLAQAFERHYGGRLHYDIKQACWFIWDLTYWRRDETRRVSSYIREICKKYNAKEHKMFAKACTYASVERICQFSTVFAVPPDHWDQNVSLLGVPGGTIDLRRGVWQKSRREDSITKQTAVSPNWDMQTPNFKKFLSEIIKGDKSFERYLQRIAGYALTGSTKEEKLFFLLGPGGNGKTKLLRVLTDAAGDYAVEAPNDLFVVKRGERHSTDIAVLVGARLVTASETDDGRRWDEPLLKKLTGGDRITARYMRQDNFTFTPQFTLLVVGNHAPELTNVDDAMRRRLQFLPFTYKPVAPDDLLAEKLRAELPGISLG